MVARWKVTIRWCLHWHAPSQFLWCLLFLFMWVYAFSSLFLLRLFIVYLLFDSFIGLIFFGLMLLSQVRLCCWFTFLWVLPSRFLDFPFVSRCQIPHISSAPYYIIVIIIVVIFVLSCLFCFLCPVCLCVVQFGECSLPDPLQVIESKMVTTYLQVRAVPSPDTEGQTRVQGDNMIGLISYHWGRGWKSKVDGWCLW